MPISRNTTSGSLCPVLGDQQGVVRQPDDDAILERPQCRILDGMSGVFADDAEYVRQRFTCRLVKRRPGHGLSDRIKESHAPFGVGNDDGVPDAPDRHANVLALSPRKSSEPRTSERLREHDRRCRAISSVDVVTMSARFLPRRSRRTRPSRLSTARLAARTRPRLVRSSIGSGNGSANVSNCSGVTVAPLTFEVIAASGGFRLRRRRTVDHTAQFLHGQGALAVEIELVADLLADRHSNCYGRLPQASLSLG